MFLAQYPIIFRTEPFRPRHGGHSKQNCQEWDDLFPRLLPAGVGTDQGRGEWGGGLQDEYV